jgi:nucleotide-binding universal stress UspA family protein
MQAPKRILVPVDYSPISDAALSEATDLAKLFGSEIVLVNVVEVIADLPNDVSLLKEGAYEDERDRSALAKVQSAADKVSASGVKAKGVIGRSNVPAKEILLTAQRENADRVWLRSRKSREGRDDSGACASSQGCRSGEVVAAARNSSSLFPFRPNRINSVVHAA